MRAPATGIGDRQARAQKMHAAGASLSEIALMLGVSTSTAHYYVKGSRPVRIRAPYDRGDFSDREGPVLCVCGAATPHAPVTNGRTNRVGDIPWGFCSRTCFEASVERFASAYIDLLPQMESRS